MLGVVYNECAGRYHSEVYRTADRHYHYLSALITLTGTEGHSTIEFAFVRLLVDKKALFLSCLPFRRRTYAYDDIFTQEDEARREAGHVDRL